MKEMRKIITILSIVMVVGALMTFMVACKPDKNTASEESEVSRVQHEIEVQLMASIAVKVGLGLLPSGWTFQRCTYNIVETSDGGYLSSGIVYIISGGETASASYSIELDSDLEKKELEIGTFYRN